MLELKKVDGKTVVDKDVSKNYSLYELKGFEVEGYEVEVSEYVYKDGGDYKSISVRKANEGEDYLPRIYYDRDRFGEEGESFKIQTTSYGTLDPSEIKKVIQGYETAMEAVAVLTKAFIK